MGEDVVGQDKVDDREDDRDDEGRDHDHMHRADEFPREIVGPVAEL